MKLIIPLKAPGSAKRRLSPVLTQEQRATLSQLMLRDMLLAVKQADLQGGTIVVCSDPDIASITDEFDVQLVPTAKDSGYCEDAQLGVEHFGPFEAGPIAIMPADIPLIKSAELLQIQKEHSDGISLCPAAVDGGTNALIFTPPLEIPLQFGVDSLQKFQSVAAEQGLSSRIMPLEGLSRDIDTCDDLRWLQGACGEGETWSYLQNFSLFETPGAN